MTTAFTCPLCLAPVTRFFYADKVREYFQCGACNLVFVPPHFHLSLQAEKAEYDLHQNSPADAGYRRFLSRLFEPLNARLLAHSSGLDFGSGPGPTLSAMFIEAGHYMHIYDKFYAPDESVLQQQYDFITATEVLEHLQHPAEILPHLWRLLQPGGYLGMMTKMVINQEKFAAWHYKNDPTHICFYSQHTFHWLAAKLAAQIEFIGTDVAILQK